MKHAKPQPKRTPIIIGAFLAALVACGTAALILYPLLTQATTEENIPRQAAVVESSLPSPSSPTTEEEPSNNKANEASAPEQATYTNNVKETLQFPVLEGGCEVAALACNLRALGFVGDFYDLADNYLVYADDGDAATGYNGDPYSFGSGFPACLSETANLYLRAQGSKGAAFQATELRGATPEELMAIVNSGWPVMVWTTMEMEPAWHTGIMYGTYEWYDNEHCVVFYGITEDGKNVLVSDPIDGLVERDADLFFEIYKDCGSLAVLIGPK